MKSDGTGVIRKENHISGGTISYEMNAILHETEEQQVFAQLSIIHEWCTIKKMHIKLCIFKNY